MITRSQLTALAPQGLVDAYLAPINETLTAFDIFDKNAQAAFLAQIIHESGGLRTFSENLNYSAAGLRATWPTRFSAELAAKYGRSATQPANQMEIANNAYAGRLGNGPPASGDGWRFRGRGPIQITGRSNYTRAGAALGLDLVGNPNALSLPREGCLAAGWFWDEGNSTGRSLNALAHDIDAVSKVVNGGTNGLAERRALYIRALGLLA